MGGEVEDRSAVLLGTTLAFGITATFLVLFRLWYRIHNRSFGVSDYCIGIAAAIQVVHMVIDTVSVSAFGYGKHEADLPPEIQNAAGATIIFWLAQILTQPVLLFSKLSLCLIYHQLLLRSDKKWARISYFGNHAAIVIIVGYYTASFFVTVFQCVPVRKTWIPSVSGRCIETRAFFYIATGFNVLTSLLVIALPLPVLLQTKQQGTKMAQLLALILLGLIDTAVSVGRMFTLSSATELNADLTWALVNLTSATAIELNLMIIAASLVVMRPALHSIHRNLFPNTSLNSLSSADGNGDAWGSSATHKFDGGKTILKTIEVELTSRSASSEEILRSQDRF